MGLLTDAFFIKALRADTTLMESLPAKDVYDNIAYPDVDMENVALPYIIVNNEGGQNLQESKDDMQEGPQDQTTVSIRIVARNHDELADMALAVRKDIRQYIIDSQQRQHDGTATDDDRLCPDTYDFHFSEIANDTLKPCFTIIFYYQCVTPNELYFDDDE